MSGKLTDNINSQYIAAANALRGKHARQRIVAYVESYDDIYFWRTVLGRFENETRYFEVMLPSKMNLTRGKKSVLMNFIGCNDKSATAPVDSPAVTAPAASPSATVPATSPAATAPAASPADLLPLGPSMIACVDADYDYVMEGATEQSRKVLQSPFVFHTYVYAIENFQCYAPSLHEVCVAVTLNDHRIFDFYDYLTQYSEACFPLFVWSVWAYRTGHHNRFSLSDFNRVCDPGGFTVQQPQASIENVRRKVQTKVRELQRRFPGNKEAYLQLKDDLRRLGITPQTTYLYMQGHHLFDTVVAPIMTKVCNQLRQERQTEINRSEAHRTQKRNEMSCYENSLQDVKAMLKKNNGYQQCPRFRQLQDDIARYLNTQ
jgi:hypothetical protein